MKGKSPWIRRGQFWTSPRILVAQGLRCEQAEPLTRCEGSSPAPSPPEQLRAALLALKNTNKPRQGGRSNASAIRTERSTTPHQKTGTTCLALQHHRASVFPRRFAQNHPPHHEGKATGSPTSTHIKMPALAERTSLMLPTRKMNTGIPAQNHHFTLLGHFRRRYKVASCFLHRPVHH